MLSEGTAVSKFDSSGTATIDAVARHANVSMKTVSRVVNGEPNVAEQTAARVREAIRALGYTPNVSAQRLASCRSKVLAMVYPRGIFLHWASYVFEAAVEEANKDGYEVIMRPCEPRELKAVASRLLTLVSRGGADAVVFLPPFGGFDKITEALTARRVLFLSIHPPDLAVPWPYVSSTNHEGASEMTRHLVSLGHRRIGFIAGHAGTRDAQERLAAYRDTLKDEGVPLDQAYMRQGDFTFESGLIRGRQLLGMKPRPSAIFASNDEMASGVIQAAYQMGLRVPDDVSVAGYDNTDSARHTAPPLTTIHVPIEEMGKTAVKMLIQQIDRSQGHSTDGAIHRELHTSLVVRESTSPPG